MTLEEWGCLAAHFSTQLSCRPAAKGRRKLVLPGVLAELMQPQSAPAGQKAEEGVRGKVVIIDLHFRAAV